MTKLVLLGSCWVAAILGCPPASLPGSNVTPKGQLSMKSNYFDVIYFAKNGLFLQRISYMSHARHLLCRERI